MVVEPRTNRSSVRERIYLTLLTITLLLYMGSLLQISLLPAPFPAVTSQQVQNEMNTIGVSEGNAVASHRKPFVFESYKAAPIEDYIMQHTRQLGYDADNAAGCKIWRTESETNPEVYAQLQQFKTELDAYNRAISVFERQVDDVRLRLDDPSQDICDTLELHPDGLDGIFTSGQLSYTASGYVEPLFPPMRSPSFCYGREALLKLDYLVHDFAAMCRKLKRTSRMVLIDMGASLQFHAGGDQPAMYLINLYTKFGFRFDHIYAYEITKQDPEKVFQMVPEDIQAAYHWINVGVNPHAEHRLNPLKMILQNYNEDDFIVIKLDVDTHSVELPLTKQLLEDERFANMVDQFYFEHHVHLEELEDNWKTSMVGSVEESLKLFRGLREKDIPSHFWV